MNVCDIIKWIQSKIIGSCFISRHFWSWISSPDCIFMYATSANILQKAEHNTRTSVLSHQHCEQGLQLQVMVLTLIMSLWTCYWVSLSLRSLAAKECSLSLHLNVFEFYFNWLETAAILWRSSKTRSQKVTLTSFRIPVFSIREQGRFQWVT